MKYVLDSSVPLKTLVPEDDSPKAKQLLAEFRNGIHQLIAPDIIAIELGHALTRAEHMKRISVRDGYRLWTTLMVDPPQLFPSSVIDAASVLYVFIGSHWLVRLPLSGACRTGKLPGCHR